MKYKNQYFQLSQVLTKYLFNTSVERSTAQAIELKYKYKTKKEEKKKRSAKTLQRGVWNGIPTHKNLVEFMSLMSLDFYQSY